MFKKIRSNRNPDDTVLTELRREFRPYIDKAGTGLKKAAESYPKFLFWVMVVNITLSIVLCLTVFRHKPAPDKGMPKYKAATVTNSFDALVQASNALHKTITLKKLIDSLTAKKTLSSADSLKLEAALDSLQKLNKQFNTK